MKFFVHFFVFIATLSVAHSQTFEEIEGEDKSQLKSDSDGGGCGYPIGIPPEYPGGVDSLHAFLGRNLIFPPTDTCGGYEKIWVGFTVETTGQVSQVKILKGSCTAYINEILWVFLCMPNWIPGKEFGKTVEVKYQIPIVFSRK